MLLPLRGMKFLEGISQPHALAVAGRVVSPSLVFMPRRGITAALPSAAGRLFADAEVDIFTPVGKYHAIRFNMHEGSRLNRITNTDLAVFAFGCSNKNVVGRTSLRKKDDALYFQPGNRNSPCGQFHGVGKRLMLFGR